MTWMPQPYLLPTMTIAAFVGSVDLYVTGAFLEDTVVDPGESLLVEYTAWNAGSEDAEDAVVGYYLSDDAIWSTDDVLLDAEELSDIDPGEGEDEQEQLSPPAVASGTWYLLVFLDHQDRIAETDETNNVASIEFQVGSACPPDMNADGILDVFDVVRFVQLFEAGDPVADFDSNGIFDINDVLIWLDAFESGC